jgi:hypothetical protein
VAAASTRILRVLRHRGVTYRRELERQVCEVGFDFATTPRWQRPEPHHLSEAIRALVQAGTVEEASVPLAGTPYRFWMLGSLTATTKASLLNRKVAATEVFERIAHIPEVSGWHAEEIHHKALLASNRWHSVGWRGGQQITTLDARMIANDRRGDVDLAGFHRATGIRFVAQVKNGREWIYPSNHDVWDLLGAAAQLQAFPIFIARRLPDSTFAFMQLVGGFAFRATKMIFPPGTGERVPIAGRPSFAEALVELGFQSDVDFIDDPLPRHRAFWTGAVNRDLEDAYGRFQLVWEQVLTLAYEERLSRDRRTGRISRRDRKVIVDEFQRTIRARDRAPGPAELMEALKQKVEEARQRRKRPRKDD